MWLSLQLVRESELFSFFQPGARIFFIAANFCQASDTLSCALNFFVVQRQFFMCRARDTYAELETASVAVDFLVLPIWFPLLQAITM